MGEWKGFWETLQKLPKEHILFVCLVAVLAKPIASLESGAAQAGFIAFILLIGCVILFMGQGISLIKENKVFRDREKARKEALVTMFNSCSLLQKGRK